MASAATVLIGWLNCFGAHQDEFAIQPWFVNTKGRCMQELTKEEQVTPATFPHH